MPFRAVIGHKRLLQLLSRAVARGSLPPSLLLSGVEGVGKRQVASALAEALNCLSPVASDAIVADGLAVDACGRCGACRRIAKGAHPDVIAIEPEETGSIKIQAIRDAINAAGFRPFEGRRRVVIVDGADALTTPAQTALLKTLEEPPPASVFILVTARPDVLLPTTRSRCVQLRFGRLTPGEIAAALIARGACGASEAHAVAALADGSLGRALAAGASDLAQVRAAAYDALSRSAPGEAARVDQARVLGRKRDAAASKGNERDDVAVHVRALESLIRDLAVLSSRAPDSALANADLRPELERLSGSYGRERIVRAFAAVGRALDALERNASPKIVLDWLAFQI
jgi:DNA polymerase-3 subunit delta'